MKRILTGLQPSGRLTLGNYIGSIRVMTEIQNEYDSFLFIADMHAITVPQDPAGLRENIKSLVALYLACGIDPTQNTIFLQSDNPFHACVSWVFECITPYGELARMTQFKDKSRKAGGEGDGGGCFGAGLLSYPALMAADILLYDADFVPVGGDQKQHVELARNIAERFNKKFCGGKGKTAPLFKLPEPLIKTGSAKIMDLQNPEKKMSKSADNEKGVIFLLDPPETAVKKIKSAVTDSEGVVRFDPVGKPGLSNLMCIYSVLTGREISSIEAEYTAGYGAFKKDLADVVVSVLAPIQARYKELRESDELARILDAGAEKTREIAQKKWTAVREFVGLCR